MSDEEIGKWVVDTCLLYGAGITTALRVALIFVESLQEDRAWPSIESETPSGLNPVEAT